MAAETSADAQMPVMIALGKLSFYFALEYLKDVSELQVSFDDSHCQILFGIFLMSLSFCYYYILFSYFHFQNIDFYKSLDIRLFFGPYWDIYLTTLLALVVGFILVIRRHA